MKLFYKFALAVILLNSSTSFSQATFTTSTGGYWSAPSTWSLEGTDSDGVPDSNDHVIIIGTNPTELVINITNASCASLKNEKTFVPAEGLEDAFFTLNILSGSNLTVSGNFDITGHIDYSRQTSLTGSGTLNVGGDINVGTNGITPTVYRTNVMNFNGPNITVAGNVNIYNRVASTIYMACSINHSAGKLSLTGNGSNGYLKTYQEGTGLNGNNKYSTVAGSAEIEFYHTTDCPIFMEVPTTTKPVFNAVGSKVTYIGTSTKSIILGNTYYKLYLNNSYGYDINDNITISNELNISKGILNVNNKFFYMNPNSSININNNGQGIAGGAQYFIYNGPVNVFYSGNITSPGIELRTGDNVNNTLLNNLSINGTSGFDLSRNGDGIYLTNSINLDYFLNALNNISINDNQLVIDLDEINATTIELNGGTTNYLDINCNMNTNEGTISITGKTRNLYGNQIIFSANSMNILGYTGSIYSNISLIATDSITVNGTNTFSGSISANNLTTNGINNFSGSVTTTNTTIKSGAITTFSNTVSMANVVVETTGIVNFGGRFNNNNYFTLNGTANFTSSNRNVVINEELLIAGNLTNSNIITTKNLNVTNNSVLTANNTNARVIVKNLLSVAAGYTLTTGNELTLLSDGTSTARVGEVEQGAISGKVYVQRYLPNTRRVWRLITAPVKALISDNDPKNSIYENWQNNGAVTGTTGTDVWGNVATYGPDVNGMYYLPISTHNFRKYNNGWSNVTNTFSEELFTTTKNNAFLAFVVQPLGSSIVGGNGGEGNGGWQSTTLIAHGELITGDQNYTINNTNYYLIGNPYASPIDFSNIIAANGENGNTITPKIWLLDPKLGSFGNYVTWDPVNKYSNAAAQNALNGQNITVIQSGQGFFVKGKTGATSTSFKINENNKTSNVLTNVFGRTASDNFERIRVNLEKVGDTIPHRDACVVGFYESANNNVDDNDVQKFSNPTETLAFLNGTTSLSSEHRLPLVDGDELFLKLTSATVSNYKLKIHTENFTFSGSAYLHDLKLGTITPMPLDGSVFEYPFEVTADATTQGTRFKIVFSTTLGSDDFNNPHHIALYPNPASKANSITVNLGKLELGTYSYRIVNMLGQEIQKGELTNQEINQEFKINFSTALSTGVYSFEILNQNKTIQTLKILIN